MGNRVGPLPDSAFLAGMNLLTVTDQRYHYAPSRNPLSKLDKSLRFRHSVCIFVRRTHLLGIPGPLRLIENEDVMGWGRSTFG